MTIPPLSMATIAYLGSVTVGLVFLLTGLAKVIEPWKFIQHVAKLGLVNPRIFMATVLSFIGLECAIGTALIMAVAPSIIVPLSMAMLVLLSFLTYWSTSTGRTEDCGCYNGWVEVSPVQSIGLNVFYTSLLIVPLIWGAWPATMLWQWMIVTATFLTSLGLAGGSYMYRIQNGKPFIDWTPIQVDRPWQAEWLDGYTEIMEGSQILIFLGPKCPACKGWLNVLKVVHNREDLPEVTGVVSVTEEEGQEYVDGYALNFPVGVLENKTWEKLQLIGVPTAVVLEDGIIKDKWTGSMPEEFIEKVLQGDVTYEVGPAQAEEELAAEEDAESESSEELAPALVSS